MNHFAELSMKEQRVPPGLHGSLQFKMPESKVSHTSSMLLSSVRLGRVGTRSHTPDPVIYTR